MSLVQSYRCDACGAIKTAKYIVGINPVQDMFDNMCSYPSVHTHLERVPVHHCLDCYNLHVNVPSENISPKAKDQHKFADTVKQYGYLFRLKCVNNWKVNKYFKKPLRKP